MSIVYLTIEQVVFLHDEIVKKTGGSLGIRDWNLLHSAIFRPQSSFAGKDLYPNIFKEAGALWQSLTKNHGFIDGNKRTSSSATLMFLEINNLKLKYSHQELVEFAVNSENKNFSVEIIAAWLQAHTIPA